MDLCREDPERWRTATEVAAKPKDGGIGRQRKDVQRELDALVDAGEFERAKGPSSRAANAVCYRPVALDWTPSQPSQAEPAPDVDGLTAPASPPKGVGASQAGRATTPPDLTELTELATEELELIRDKFGQGGADTCPEPCPAGEEEAAGPQPAQNPHSTSGQVYKSGPEQGTNGWSPEAADAFIRRAHEVFPGSVEIDANGRPVADEDDLSDLSPEQPLPDPASKALAPERCDGAGHDTRPVRDEFGDWRCFLCGRGCDPPGCGP